MKKLIVTMLVILGVLVSGCSGTPGALGVGWYVPAFVPITNVANVSANKLRAAQQIVLYNVEDRNYPEVEKSLGRIEGYSVKHLLWEPSPSQENALIQLKLKALDLGAHGIISISFSRIGLPEASLIGCYESIKVTGEAVVFKK